MSLEAIPAPTSPKLVCLNFLGLVPFREAWELQKEWAARRREGEWPDGLILLEHPPVLTLGRWGEKENLKVSAEYLKRKNMALIRCERGGEITYHGPGQLVGYPILRLKSFHLGVRTYVSRLEEVLIRTLFDFGLAAGRREGFPGVWINQHKIASIGIAVQKGIAFHGFALNYAPDLDHFRFITPCGLPGVEMTSIEAITGRPLDPNYLRERVTRNFGEVFEAEIVPVSLETLNLETVAQLTKTSFRTSPSKRDEIRNPDPVPAQAGNQNCYNLDPGSLGRDDELRRGLQLKKPPWLKKPIAAGGSFHQVEGLIEKAGLHTVCREAQCPNQGECFSRGTAAFLLMGDRCTRRCTFCAVSPGLPNPLNPEEPAEIARAVKKMGLSYAVLTSVTRDDLSDGGAGHFCETIEAIGRVTPQTQVECLIPDFQGSKPSLDLVARAGPAVINHNLETVERLYPSVRPGADFKRSLQLIGYLKETFPGLLTKSGIMVGLGETREETMRVLEDLRDQGCQILTIGQYLQPSPEHHPVVRYVPPDEFAGWAEEACQLGFKAVACGPFVRSSFEAEGLYAKARSSPPRRIGDPSPIGEERIFCCLS